MPSLRAAMAPKKQTDDDCGQDPEDHADPWIEREILAAVRGDEIRHREAGDAVHGRLREGDHAAVSREEREADRGDPEPERLRQDLAEEVLAEDERAQRKDHEDDDGHTDSDPCSPAGHAGLPKRPSGRTASTKIEQCERQQDRVVRVVVSPKMR